VLYVGTLSKIFAPGIRVGYLVAPVDVADRVRLLSNAIEIHGDQVFEAAVAELFEDGDLQRHVNRARRTYCARRDALAALLRQYLGNRIEFRIPAGGLALWCRIAPEIDVSEWTKRARAQDLFFNAGSSYFAKPKVQPFIRLGFARMNEAELTEAARRLAKALPNEG
jgi:GntR family transcriptional regulator/MocR family aminotransferase